jgi:hypothetical protein
MARKDQDRVNYAVVALERREDRELVELYAKSLSIPFPVAMADNRGGSSAAEFGPLNVLPVTILLDRTGRAVWRASGRVARSDELRAVLRGL